MSWAISPRRTQRRRVLEHGKVVAEIGNGFLADGAHADRRSLAEPSPRRLIRDHVWLFFVPNRETLSAMSAAPRE